VKRGQLGEWILVLTILGGALWWIVTRARPGSLPW
jgi:hypothetical protein